MKQLLRCLCTILGLAAVWQAGCLRTPQRVILPCDYVGPVAVFLFEPDGRDDDGADLLVDEDGVAVGIGGNGFLKIYCREPGSEDLRLLDVSGEPRQGSWTSGSSVVGNPTTFTFWAGPSDGTVRVLDEAIKHGNRFRNRARAVGGSQGWNR